MNKVCLGCGVGLQCTSSKDRGYVIPDKLNEAIYCERCFRLKHYHDLTFDSLTLDNQEILKRANCYGKPIYYFVDLMNLSDYAIQYFKQISGEKVLVLTKVDLLPFSISLELLQQRIQKIYDISEEILWISVKRPKMIRTLWNHLLKQGCDKIVFLGMTNVGKSSFLNELFKLVFEREAEVLVSEMPNTTQDFLEWNLKDMTIVDAPGFNYPKENLNSFTKLVPKKSLRPITLPMKNNALLLLEENIAIAQNLVKNSITFYGSNALELKRIYDHFPKFSSKETLTIPAYSDLVFPGVGFFYFKNKTNITLMSSQSLFYEVRDSLFGGQYDSN